MVWLIYIWYHVPIVDLETDEDIDAYIESKKSPTPYILATGEDILHIGEFFLVCENRIIQYKLKDFKSAVITLSACHYVFNLEYSSHTHILCKFFEKFCLNMVNVKKLTIGVISAIIELQT